jgi:hypothetical protein
MISHLRWTPDNPFSDSETINRYRASALTCLPVEFGRGGASLYPIACHLSCATAFTFIELSLEEGCVAMKSTYVVNLGSLNRSELQNLFSSSFKCL